MGTRAACKAALKTLIEGAVKHVDARGFEGEADRPAQVGRGGTVVLLNIDDPPANIDLGVLVYHKRPEFNLEVQARQSETVEAMLSAIGDAVRADRTLDGTSEWTDIEGFDDAPEIEPGSAGYYAARVAVIAEYSTTNPSA